MNSGPVYIVSSDDGRMHLSVGIESTTICGQDTVLSADQVESVERHLEELEDKGETICEDCHTIWRRVSHKVSPEPVISCHRCGRNYSVVLSRMVESMSDGQVTVCRPCYNDLYRSNNSNVAIPYEDAEPYYNMSGDRNIDLDIDV